MNPVIIGKATLYQMDCMELLKATPDKFYELAIVDPPYAVGASNGNFGRGGNKSAQPKVYRTDLKNYANHNSIPDKEYFDELFRVSKNQIIWGANYYPQFLNHGGWIVWDKLKKDGLMSDGELAYQSIDKKVKIFKHEWEGFRKGSGSFESGVNSIIHPNQKPNVLYEWLLTNYAKQGDKILDTHGGSMSSVIACLNLGFDITCSELDSDYFKASIKRVEQSQAQSTLFEPSQPAIQQKQEGIFA